MTAWKVCTAMAATLLTALAVRAEDGPATIGSPATITVTSGDATLVAGGSGTITIAGNVSDDGKATLAVGPMTLTLQGGYWMGVVPSRPSPELRAQLKLPKDQGIVVESVEPEGPASKAGLQQYDVLLKGNGKPLNDPNDLIQLINEVKEGKLKLELVRAGKQETVTVTPAKRPDGQVRVVPEIVRGWLNESTSPEGGSVQFHIVGPGQILPPAGAIPPGGAAKGSGALMQAKTKLADGTKIEISREGHEPAKVVVTRDKEKWEGTSNDLSKIPENIRPDVERLLHPAFDHDSFFAKQGATGTIVAGGPVALFSGAIRPPGGSGLSVVSPEVEKRLSDLQKQVDELRRAVDALQSQPAKKSKTAKSE